MCTKIQQHIYNDTQTQQKQLEIEVEIWNGFKPLVLLGRFLGVFNPKIFTSREFKSRIS